MKQKISIIGDGIIGKMMAIALHDLNFDVSLFHDQKYKKANERYFSINLLSKYLFAYLIITLFAYLFFDYLKNNKLYQSKYSGIYGFMESCVWNNDGKG